MLDCLCFIRKHVLKHDLWNEMYCFKAGDISIWTIKQNLWTSEWGIWIMAYEIYNDLVISFRLFSLKTVTVVYPFIDSTPPFPVSGARWLCPKDL
jgi:hypothetical protein